MPDGRGMSMTLETAERNGFIKRGADGRYEDMSKDQLPKEVVEAAEEQAKLNDEPSQEAESPGLSFTNEAADEIGAVSQKFAQAGLNPVSMLGAFLARPDELPPHFKAYAEHHGMNETDANAQFGRIRDGIDDALDDYIFQAGISQEQRDGFWEFYHSQPERIAAITEALITGNTKPLKQVVERFKSGHGRGKGSATQTETHRGYAGQAPVETVIGPNGIRTSVENARRLGWV